jgi:hypothetical protein
MYRLYGMAAAILFVLGAAGFTAMNRVTDFKPAKASVYLIDRKCDIVETTKTPDGRAKSSRIYNDECKSIDAWEAARSKRDKTISGKAVVKVSYTAPQDGSYQSSELEFTSRDDEFYDLKAGDEIEILVSNSDPTNITAS